MKLLVLSDSHRMLSYMQKAIEAEKPDYVIHLGDHTRDADALKEAYPHLPIVSIRGNCDFADTAPERSIQEWDGVRILMTHGHIYGVKSNLLRLSLAAKEACADIALFGHTHLALCRKMGDLWLLNPGSCNSMGGGPTCGIIEIQNGVPVCTVKTID